MMRGIWRRQLALAVALGAAWIVAAHFVLLPLTAAWLPETGLLLIGGLLLWRWVERTARRQEREIERQAELVRQSLENGQPLPVLAGELAETLVAELRPVWEERERRQAASQMRAERLHAILESLDTAVVAAAADRRVIFANSAAARLLHWGTPPAAGERLTALPRIAQLEQWASEVITAAAPAGGRLRLPDERTLQVVLTPLEGGGFVLLAHDMTETSRLETLRRDFIAGVSHELRTPLQSMQGETELALVNQAPLHECRRVLESNLEEIDRLNRMIRNLLVLAQADAGEVKPRLEPMDLNELVRDLVDQMRVVASAREVRLRAFTSAPVPIMADGLRLRQMMLNLLDNALKYTPAGGWVEVRVDRRHGVARVQVSDSGVGILAEDLPHIFERFYRADKSRSRGGGADGCGLGLPIVKWVAETHGGRVEVHSVPGAGSEFQVHLPLAGGA